MEKIGGPVLHVLVPERKGNGITAKKSRRGGRTCPRVQGET